MTRTTHSTISAGRAQSSLKRPRLGFVGVGWIGRHRMQAVSESGVAEIAALADASDEALAAAAGVAADAQAVASFEEILDVDLDGLVIATPSALHAEQARQALQRGMAVFCQKPLARTADETRRIVETARQQNRLLGVDLSYRFVSGVEQMRRLIRSGELGQIYALDLTFHNAYGPDKPWFYDPQLAGGGCLIDLGIHLADLALWMLDYPEVTSLASRLFQQGRRLADPQKAVEDYAVVTCDFAGGATCRLACSWRLPAGRDAVIEAAFYGTDGAVSLRNVEGSFFDFLVQRHQGTQSETLAAPPDDWGGRCIVDWAERLGAGGTFDESAARLVEVAELLDRSYGR